ncbi:GAF domain-containing protein [Deinococcus yavapaiensis KR-236]|uniref:histidine kinase n=2 Tax=Deinococcus TaxID=1298 RepID=A0A318S516_9DEIO|nr:GAF domain-containing protein [Deinococcus yavapaiensis KR-236]
MLLRRKDLSLLRTLAIAAGGITLPFLWPDIFANLLRPLPAMAGHQDGWPATLTTLHVGSDLLIGMSYTVIASILAYMVYRNRRTLPFDWVVLAFGLFIVACGLTHVMHVLVRFVPLMWLDGYVRAVTAIVSVATAAALPPLVPRVSRLLEAERQVAEQRHTLERTNDALLESVARSELLAALGDALQSATTTREVELAALERLTPALDASAMLVLTLEGERVRSSTVQGTPPRQVAAMLCSSEILLTDTPVLADVVKTKSALYLDDYEARPDAAANVRGMSYGVEPIVTRDGSVVGAVAAWRRRGLGSWTPGQRDLMRRAAATIGLALERAGVAAETARQRDALALANEQLRHSNAELEQFAYVASHDLQAPIRAVTSFAQVVEGRYGDRLDERGRSYLEQISANGQHMKRLLDDLLAYARLTTHLTAPDVVSMNEVFDAVAARLAPDVERWGATLTREELPSVRVDRPQVDQLLQNLLYNAVKYHRPDVAPMVRVSATRDEAMWHFRVIDNGIGIEDKYFERIFVIFQRLHGRERFEGTGIGLAVCKKIVERHGGRLWVESRVGVGSTFHFTLPA